MTSSSNHLLESLVLHSPIATGLFNGPELTLTLASKAFLQLFAPEQVLAGKSVDEIAETLRSSDLQALLVKVFISGKDHVDQEVLFSQSINGNLRERYFDLTYTVLKDPAGTAIGVLATGVEVTAQVEVRKRVERNEHSLSLAIQAAEMGTWEFYPQTLELKFNSRTRELSGFNPTEEVTLAKTLEYIHPEDREHVQ